MGNCTACCAQRQPGRGGGGVCHTVTGEKGGEGGGGGPPAPKSGLPRAEGARFTKIFENLKIFEKFLLKNAIKMIFGDLLKKFFLNFFYKK